MKEHALGDYLYKNGNIYKIVSHWEDLFAAGNLFSICYQESVNKLFPSPYLIDKRDSSYLPATKEQIKQFDSMESGEERWETPFF